MKKSHQRGFTIIELLVVIGIICILIAIIFPVFATARQKANQSVCLSNERQIGLAEMTYCQDYDEAFWSTPFPGTVVINGFCSVPACAGTVAWSDLLMPYVQSTGVFSCPSNQDATDDPGLYTPPAYRVTYGFATNGPHGDQNFGPWTLGMLQKPEQIALITDAVYAFDSPNCEQDPEKPAGVGSWYFSRGVNDQDFVGKPRHFDGMNFVYADGHAKWGKVSGATPSAADDLAGYYPTARIIDGDCLDFTQ